MREDRRCAALCLFHVMKTPNSSAFVFCLNKLGFGMVRPRISLLVGFSLCVFGSAAIAQSDSTRTNADPAVAAAPKRCFLAGPAKLRGGREGRSPGGGAQEIL
jgi:hypothetical protein